MNGRLPPPEMTTGNSHWSASPCRADAPPTAPVGHNDPAPVADFFTASCAALPTLAPAWRDIDTLVVNDVRAPVLWIALQPNDVQADTAYRELGLGGTQLWISYSNEYRKLGIDIVPRAWVVANDLRFYGLAATPAETRELIADCSRSRQRKLTE